MGDRIVNDEIIPDIVDYETPAFVQVYRQVVVMREIAVTGMIEL